MATISIDVDANSTIAELSAFILKIDAKLDTFCQRLAEIGYQVASMGFGNAIYDGTNDVSVSIESNGFANRAIVAVGNATMFIEFGTGITYPDVHPQMAEMGMVRGGYGHGYGGLANGWRYPESHGAGSNGQPDPKHPGYIHTMGNPANMPMYNATQEIKQNIERIAREVFAT